MLDLTYTLNIAITMSHFDCKNKVYESKMDLRAIIISHFYHLCFKENLVYENTEDVFCGIYDFSGIVSQLGFWY